MSNELTIYNGKVFGEEVSEYGLKKGYLDYYTLAKIVGDRILNNEILNVNREEWYLISGDEFYEEDNEVIYLDVYQCYIISDSGYNILSKYTDEIVYYNETLDMYLWGITHFGTGWDYVLTDIKLIGGENNE